jgi:hypothetical protein
MPHFSVLCITGHSRKSKGHIHNPHAIILHLMGMEFQKLACRYQGHDFRLTDVHENVVHDRK